MTDTAETAEAKPTRLPPVITLDAKFFWDHANEGEFVCQRCADCGAYRFPPRPMCPHCRSLATEIAELSGRGTVYTWIRPQRPQPAGFDEPPVVALIELEEGFRFVSNLVDIAFEDVTAGMPVEVLFAPTMKNKRVPVFRPAGVQGGQ